MVSDKKCVMCDSGVGKNVVHFQVGYGEFERDGRCCWIVGAVSGWGNFGELTGEIGGIAVGKRSGGSM